MSDPAADRLRRALAVIETLEAQLRGLEAERREPIAIIGMGCRFPGAPDLASFWHMLRAGRDGLGPIPAQRWDVEAHYDPDPDAAGKSYARSGGFLDPIDGFDADFFHLSPRETRALDPQHRLFLEVAWEALEDAGLPAPALAGKSAGVFVGVMNNEYLPLYIGADLRNVDAYVPTGTTLNAIAGRLSYFLGIHGPSLAIDTACSSSLVALHLACQSLRSGESELAFAGGVNLILSPIGGIAMARTGALARDGRCKTFSADADGFARGEGCGVVVLKTRSRALADGDRILALVRGSAVNQDGASSGLTVPNGRAQAAVVRAALHAAGVAPAQIGYVEAHGTGTALGDPIEVRALASVFAGRREQPLLLGSVKTNLGHLEPAAGIAGLIKTVLALGHQEVPPSVLVGELNSLLPLAEIPALVPTTVTRWDGPRFAGVSAFSLTGTNAHVVLEEAASVAAPPLRPTGEAFWAVPLSGHSIEALRAAAVALADCLAAPAPLRTRLEDLGFTAARRRSHHRHRLVAVAADAAGLIERLMAFVAGEPRDGLVCGESIPGHSRRLVWVFSGHGAHWLGMGRGLLDRPEIVEALREVEHALAPHLTFSVSELLNAQDPRYLDDVARVQPTVFALQIAVARALHRFGIYPDAVIGHSMGEVAAAHLAGILSLADAAHVIALRSRLLAETAGSGGMVATGLSWDQAEREIHDQRDRLAVAVDASPTSVAISGNLEALHQLKGRLDGRGVFCRWVKTEVAFHGPQMDPLLARLRDGLAGISPRAGELPMFSTVRGHRIDGGALGAAYWAENLRQPVRLRQATEVLLADGYDSFVEIGPHPVVLPSIAQSAGPAHPELTLIPTLQRDRDDEASLLASVGALHCVGRQVDWAARYPRGSNVSLPTYPWQRQRYWPSTAVPPPAPTRSLWFQIGWHAVDDRSVPVVPTSPAGSWLVVRDRHGRADALIAELRSRGVVIASVQIGAAGSGFVCRDELVYQVDAADPGGFDPLFAVLDARSLRGELPPLLGVADLTALDPCEDLDIATRGRALARNTLHLVQALARRRTAAAPRLWIVTEGARAVGTHALQLAATPLHGLAQVVNHELPELRCTTFDLDPASATSAFALASVVLADSRERQLAKRADALLAARVVPLELAAGVEPWQARTDGCYLVTGGVTGLGLRTAEWLASRGAGALLLISRRDPDADAALRIAALVAAGVTVRHERADVSDREQLRAALTRARAELPPLRGVIHSAGVMANGILAHLDDAQLDRVLLPKLAGALHLHELTRDQPLELFVLYSSLVATLGSPGQGNYVAANSFLDALAHHRRALGLPALSIGWAPWRDAALLHRDDGAADRRLSGPFAALALEIDEALAALAQVLAGAPPHIAVMPFSLERWQAEVPDLDGQPWLFALRPAHSIRPSTAPRGVVRARLTAAESESRARSILAEHLRTEAAQVLKRSGADIDARTPLLTLGFDSLTGLELRRRLEVSLELALPATLIYDHPTLAALADALLVLARPTPSVAEAKINALSVAEPVPTSASLSQATLATLSEVDAETLLLEQLQRLRTGSQP